MPWIVALVDTGEPLRSGVTKKEHIEVLEVSTGELRQAVREGRLAELIARASKEAEKTINSSRIIGYYLKAKSLHRLGLNRHLFKSGRDF